MIFFKGFNGFFRHVGISLAECFLPCEEFKPFDGTVPLVGFSHRRIYYGQTDWHDLFANTVTGNKGDRNRFWDSEARLCKCNF